MSSWESQYGACSAQGYSVPLGYSTASPNPDYCTTLVSPGESEPGSVFSSSSNDTQLTIPQHPSFAGTDYEHQLRMDPILPCEFATLTGCRHPPFHLSEEDEWIVHHANDHLGNKFPKTLMCPVCDRIRFPWSDSNSHPQDIFWSRMWHWAEHFRNGENLGEPRIDYYMVEHLAKCRIITPQQYEELIQRGGLRGELPAELYAPIADGVLPSNNASENRRSGYPRGQVIDQATEDRHRRGRRHRRR